MAGKTFSHTFFVRNHKKKSITHRQENLKQQFEARVETRQVGKCGTNASVLFVGMTEVIDMGTTASNAFRIMGDADAKLLGCSVNEGLTDLTFGLRQPGQTRRLDHRQPRRASAQEKDAAANAVSVTPVFVDN